MNPEELDDLDTEARNPASLHLDAMTALEIVQLMNAEDTQVIRAVALVKDEIARAIEEIAARLGQGGRLVYMGAGTSGRLGVLDASECPPTFNTPPELVVGLIAGGPAALTRAVEGAEDHPESGVQDLEAIGFSAKDVLVGIATSGRTPYVLGGVQHASKIGALAVGICCNRDSALSAAVQIAIIPLVGAEVLSGSTRLKAGTATKLVLNMLSTGVMVRLGKTYGNLMVDLRATNTKLNLRTNRIIRVLTGLSVGAANDLLEECAGELKTALVSALASLPPAAARERLKQHGGQVRAALTASLPSPAPRGPGLGSRALRTLVLGVDGGGTKTVALLARVSDKGEHTLLGRGRAAGSNPQVYGVGTALQHVERAIHAAFQQAGIPATPVAALCLGLAGAGRSDDRQILAGGIRQKHLAAHLDIRNDVELLFAAGTPAGWGLAVVAGTGSIASSRGPDGRIARAGGWGDVMGDEGSGFAISRAALQSVARSADGRGPRTFLTDRLLAHFQVLDPQQLIEATRLADPRGELAPLVFEAADLGDEEARAILQQGIQELAVAAVSAIRHLDLEGVPVPLVLAGGLLVGNVGYREALVAELRLRGLQLDPIQIVAEPAQGALLIAALMIAK